MVHKSFKDYFHEKFPKIPLNKWGISGEPFNTAMDRYLNTASEYISKAIEEYKNGNNNIAN